MTKVFEICFYTGALLTLISFVLGQFLDFGDFDGVDLDIEIPGFNIIPVRPLLITMFITFFGGIGLFMSDRDIALWIIIMVATSIGLGVTILTEYGIIQPLQRRQTKLTGLEDLIDLDAVAKIDIGLDNFGEILYEIEDRIYSAPAKSIYRNHIPKGTNVVIKKIDNNIFYVEKRED